MIKCRLLVWLMVGVFLTAPAAARQKGGGGQKKHAEQKKHKTQKRKNKQAALRGEYAIMANVVGMSEQQRNRFAEKLTARNKAMAECKKKNAEKMKQLSRAMKQAKADNDEEKIKELKAGMKELKQEQKQVSEKCKAEMMSVLTPQQRNEWEGFKVYRKLMRKYGKLELTDRQKTKVRSICKEYGEKLNSASPKEQKQITQQIRERAEQVLTEEQRAALKAGKKGKTDKPAKKSKAGRKGKGGNDDSGGGK